MSKRILLTQEDFQTLISGGIVEQDDVQIALQDIGYFNMLDIIKFESLKKIYNGKDIKVI